MTLKTYKILIKREDLKLNNLFDQEFQSTALWPLQEVNNHFEINSHFWYIEIKIAYFQFIDEVSFMFPKELYNATDAHLFCHIIRTLLILTQKFFYVLHREVSLIYWCKTGCKKCQQVSNITVKASPEEFLPPQYFVPCYFDHLA